MCCLRAAFRRLPRGVPPRVRPRRAAPPGAGSHRRDAQSAAARLRGGVLCAVVPHAVHLPASARAAREECDGEAGGPPLGFIDFGSFLPKASTAMLLLSRRRMLTGLIYNACQVEFAGILTLENVNRLQRSEACLHFCASKMLANSNSPAL